MSIITPAETLLHGVGKHDATVLSPKYTSGNQTLTAASLLTLAHLLGAIPVIIKLQVKCLTAEFGYSVNDVVDVAFGGLAFPAGNGQFAVYADATNVYVRMDATLTIYILHKTTGAASTMTKTSWALIVKAW